MRKRFSKRGMSTIIGTLLMVAIVAVIGSVILFQALNGINDFNYYLSFLTGTKNNINESAVIEHVHFDGPTSNILQVTVRNTGSSEIQITKMSVVNLNTQTLVFSGSPNNAIVPLVDETTLSETMNNIDGAGGGTWGSFETDQYKISLTTSFGNAIETTAIPYNS